MSAADEGNENAAVFLESVFCKHQSRLRNLLRLVGEECGAESKSLRLLHKLYRVSKVEDFISAANAVKKCRALHYIYPEEMRALCNMEVLNYIVHNWDEKVLEPHFFIGVEIRVDEEEINHRRF